MEPTPLTSKMLCFTSWSSTRRNSQALLAPGKPAPQRANFRPAALPAILGVLGVCSLHAETFDLVSKQLDTPAATVWRIENPTVKQKLQEYPDIAFAPGDRVMATAGGCVQTGGTGKTWKRYVDPSGPNSDRLYHGLIHVPGVNSSPERFQQFGMNIEHPIASIPIGQNGADAHLQLGYEDDQFDDNGYEKHDDGTEDQCKESVNAFIIISVGHSGNPAPAATSFVGITPDNYRCQAAWAFHNFSTPRLSLDSFTDAFDFQWYDYLDPVVGIAFLAARDSLAAGGNCMGMSFLADAAENQFIVGDLEENLWDNYKNRNVATPQVTKDINTAHWAQMSVAFLNYYLNNVVRSPADNAALVERDLTRDANANYGLISIAHETKGHVLVPLRVRHSGTTALIDVYDSNRPCTSNPDPASYPPIVINGDSWSYEMPSGKWSGSTANDGLAYIPYTGASGWRRFGADFAGAIQLIFGSNTNVEQVTDTNGRRLFLPGTQTVDTSDSGLGREVLRMPVYGQSRPRNADPLYLVENPAKPPLDPAVFARFEREYGADYGNLQSAFIVRTENLSGLTFQVSSANASKPVRGLIFQRGQFFEIKATASSRLAMTIPNPAALAAQGIYLKNDSATPISVVLASGKRADGAVHIQTTSPISIPASIQVELSRATTGLNLRSKARLQPVSINDIVTTTDGRKSKVLTNVGVTRIP